MSLHPPVVSSTVQNPMIPGKAVRAGRARPCCSSSCRPPIHPPGSPLHSAGELSENYARLTVSVNCLNCRGSTSSWARRITDMDPPATHLYPMPAAFVQSCRSSSTTVPGALAPKKWANRKEPFHWFCRVWMKYGSIQPAFLTHRCTHLPLLQLHVHPRSY